MDVTDHSLRPDAGAAHAPLPPSTGDQPGTASPSPEAPARASLVEIVADGARQPLAALRHLAAGVAEVRGVTPAAALAGRIQARLHELVSLLGNALDYERLLEGRSLVEPAGFDLRAMLDEFAVRLRTPLGAGWTLETSTTADVPMALVGDPGRWRDVLEILLLELASVAESGVARLEVSRLEESPSQVVLRLQLRARPAAAPETRTLEAVLRRLSSLATDRPLNAASMRADLARRLVAANGGALRDPVLDGTTLFLEVHAPFGLRAVTGAVRGPAPRADLRGVRLLLAGAGHRQSRQQVSLLRLWGCEVTVATDGLGALHELRAARDAGRGFDLAMVSDDLGGMDGQVFGRLVRVHPDLRDLRMALLVELGVRGDSQVARAIGFDAYLPGTLPGRELREALLELLSRDCAAARGSSILTRHDLAEMRNERRRVLLVGFQGVDALVLRSLLERRGFSSRAVEAGAEGIETWERERHDLVVVRAWDDEESVATAIALQVLLDEDGGVPLMLVLDPETPATRAQAEQAGIRYITARETDPHGLCEQVELLLLGNVPRQPVAPSARRPGLEVVSGLERDDDYPVLSRARLGESSLGMPALELELIDTFLHEAGPRIERLERLGAEGDAQELARATVDLKGLAMTVGAYALGRVCAAVEGFAHEGGRADLAPMLRRLAEESSKACRELESHRRHVVGEATDAA